MPFPTQSLHALLQDHLLAAFTLPIETACMTAHTPSIPILFDKRRLLIKWVATLSAEEVPFMPLSTASQHHLPFNRGLAATASGGKELMEVEVAVEA